MASFTSGSSPLLATSLEGAVMEICQRIQDLEKAANETPNNMAVNYFTGDNVCQIAATIPFTQTVSSTTGAVEFTGTDFITDPNWSNGGDIVGTTLGAAALELIQLLQIAESADSNAGNNVTISFDTETSIATVAIEIPVVFVGGGTDGAVSITAQQYTA